MDGKQFSPRQDGGTYSEKLRPLNEWKRDSVFALRKKAVQIHHSHSTAASNVFEQMLMTRNSEEFQQQAPHRAVTDFEHAQPGEQDQIFQRLKLQVQTRFARREAHQQWQPTQRGMQAVALSHPGEGPQGQEGARRAEQEEEEEVPREDKQPPEQSPQEPPNDQQQLPQPTSNLITESFGDESERGQDLFTQCQNHLHIINACTDLQQTIKDEMKKQAKLDNIIYQRMSAKAERLHQQAVVLRGVQIPKWAEQALEELGSKVNHQAQAHQVYMCTLIEQCATIQHSLDGHHELMKRVLAHSKDMDKSASPTGTQQMINALSAALNSESPKEGGKECMSFLHASNLFEDIRKPRMKLFNKIEYLKSQMISTTEILKQVEDEIASLKKSGEGETPCWRIQLQIKDCEIRKEFLETHKEELDSDLKFAGLELADSDFANRDKMLEILNVFRQHRVRYDATLRKSFQLLQAVSLRDMGGLRTFMKSNEPPQEFPANNEKRNPAATGDEPEEEAVSSKAWVTQQNPEKGHTCESSYDENMRSGDNWQVSNAFNAMAAVAAKSTNPFTDMIAEKRMTSSDGDSNVSDRKNPLMRPRDTESAVYANDISVLASSLEVKNDISNQTFLPALSSDSEISPNTPSGGRIVSNYSIHKPAQDNAAGGEGLEGVVDINFSRIDAKLSDTCVVNIKSDSEFSNAPVTSPSPVAIHYSETTSQSRRVTTYMNEGDEEKERTMISKYVTGLDPSVAHTAYPLSNIANLVALKPETGIDNGIGNPKTVSRNFGILNPFRNENELERRGEDEKVARLISKYTSKRQSKCLLLGKNFNNCEQMWKNIEPAPNLEDEDRLDFEISQILCLEAQARNIRVCAVRPIPTEGDNGNTGDGSQTSQANTGEAVPVTEKRQSPDGGINFQEYEVTAGRYMLAKAETCAPHCECEMNGRGGMNYSNNRQPGVNRTSHNNVYQFGESPGDSKAWSDSGVKQPHQQNAFGEVGNGDHQLVSTANDKELQMSGIINVQYTVPPRILQQLATYVNNEKPPREHVTSETSVDPQPALRAADSDTAGARHDSPRDPLDRNPFCYNSVDRGKEESLFSAEEETVPKALFTNEMDQDPNALRAAASRHVRTLYAQSGPQSEEDTWHSMTATENSTSGRFSKPTDERGLPTLMLMNLKSQTNYHARATDHRSVHELQEPARPLRSSLKRNSELYSNDSVALSEQDGSASQEELCTPNQSIFSADSKLSERSSSGPLDDSGAYGQHEQRHSSKQTRVCKSPKGMKRVRFHYRVQYDDNTERFDTEQHYFSTSENSQGVMEPSNHSNNAKYDQVDNGSADQNRNQSNNADFDASGNPRRESPERDSYSSRGTQSECSIPIYTTDHSSTCSPTFDWESKQMGQHQCHKQKIPFSADLFDAYCITRPRPRQGQQRGTRPNALFKRSHDFKLSGQVGRSGPSESIDMRPSHHQIKPKQAVFQANETAPKPQSPHGDLSSSVSHSYLHVVTTAHASASRPSEEALPPVPNSQRKKKSHTPSPVLEYNKYKEKGNRSKCSPKFYIGDPLYASTPRLYQGRELQNEVRKADAAEVTAPKYKFDFNVPHQPKYFTSKYLIKTSMGGGKKSMSQTSSLTETDNISASQYLTGPPRGNNKLWHHKALSPSDNDATSGATKDQMNSFTNRADGAELPLFLGNQSRSSLIKQLKALMSLGKNEDESNNISCSSLSATKKKLENTDLNSRPHHLEPMRLDGSGTSESKLQIVNDWLHGVKTASRHSTNDNEIPTPPLKIKSMELNAAKYVSHRWKIMQEFSEILRANPSRHKLNKMEENKATAKKRKSSLSVFTRKSSKPGTSLRLSSLQSLTSRSLPQQFRKSRSCKTKSGTILCYSPGFNYPPTSVQKAKTQSVVRIAQKASISSRNRFSKRVAKTNMKKHLPVQDRNLVNSCPSVRRSRLKARKMGVKEALQGDSYMACMTARSLTEETTHLTEDGTEIISSVTHIPPCKYGALQTEPLQARESPPCQTATRGRTSVVPAVEEEDIKVRAITKSDSLLLPAGSLASSGRYTNPINDVYRANLYEPSHIDQWLNAIAQVADQDRPLAGNTPLRVLPKPELKSPGNVKSHVKNGYKRLHLKQKMRIPGEAKREDTPRPGTPCAADSANTRMTPVRHVSQSEDSVVRRQGDGDHIIHQQKKYGEASGRASGNKNPSNSKGSSGKRKKRPENPALNPLDEVNGMAQEKSFWIERWLAAIKAPDNTAVETEASGDVLLNSDTSIDCVSDSVPRTEKQPNDDGNAACLVQAACPNDPVVPPRDQLPVFQKAKTANQKLQGPHFMPVVCNTRVSANDPTAESLNVATSKSLDVATIESPRNMQEASRNRRDCLVQTSPCIQPTQILASLGSAKIETNENGKPARDDCSVGKVRRYFTNKTSQPLPDRPLKRAPPQTVTSSRNRDLLSTNLNDSDVLENPGSYAKAPDLQVPNDEKDCRAKDLREMKLQNSGARISSEYRECQMEFLSTLTTKSVDVHGYNTTKERSTRANEVHISCPNPRDSTQLSPFPTADTELLSPDPHGRSQMSHIQTHKYANVWTCADEEKPQPVGTLKLSLDDSAVEHGDIDISTCYREPTDFYPRTQSSAVTSSTRSKEHRNACSRAESPTVAAITRDQEHTHPSARVDLKQNKTALSSSAHGGCPVLAYSPTHRDCERCKSQLLCIEHIPQAVQSSSSRGGSDQIVIGSQSGRSEGLPTTSVHVTERPGHHRDVPGNAPDTKDENDQTVYRTDINDGTAVPRSRMSHEHLPVSTMSVLNEQETADLLTGKNQRTDGPNKTLHSKDFHQPLSTSSKQTCFEENASTKCKHVGTASSFSQELATHQGPAISGAESNVALSEIPCKQRTLRTDRRKSDHTNDHKETVDTHDRKHCLLSNDQPKHEQVNCVSRETKVTHSPKMFNILARGDSNAITGSKKTAGKSNAKTTEKDATFSQADECHYDKTENKASTLFPANMENKSSRPAQEKSTICSELKDTRVGQGTHKNCKVHFRVSKRTRGNPGGEIDIERCTLPTTNREDNVTPENTTLSSEHSDIPAEFDNTVSVNALSRRDCKASFRTEDNPCRTFSDAAKENSKVSTQDSSVAEDIKVSAGSREDPKASTINREKSSEPSSIPAAKVATEEVLRHPPHLLREGKKTIKHDKKTQHTELQHHESKLPLHANTPLEEGKKIAITQIGNSNEVHVSNKDHRRDMSYTKESPVTKGRPTQTGDCKFTHESNILAPRVPNSLSGTGSPSGSIDKPCGEKRLGDESCKQEDVLKNDLLGCVHGLGPASKLQPPAEENMAGTDVVSKPKSRSCFTRSQAGNSWSSRLDAVNKGLALPTSAGSACLSPAGEHSHSQTLFPARNNRKSVQSNVNTSLKGECSVFVVLTERQMRSRGSEKKDRASLVDREHMSGDASNGCLEQSHLCQSSPGAQDTTAQLMGDHCTDKSHLMVSQRSPEAQHTTTQVISDNCTDNLPTNYCQRSPDALDTMTQIMDANCTDGFHLMVSDALGADLHASQENAVNSYSSINTTRISNVVCDQRTPRSSLTDNSPGAAVCKHVHWQQNQEEEAAKSPPIADEGLSTNGNSSNTNNMTSVNKVSKNTKGARLTSFKPPPNINTLKAFQFGKSKKLVAPVIPDWLQQLNPKRLAGLPGWAALRTLVNVVKMFRFSTVKTSNQKIQKNEGISSRIFVLEDSDSPLTKESPSDSTITTNTTTTYMTSLTSENQRSSITIHSQTPQKTFKQKKETVKPLEKMASRSKEGSLYVQPVSSPILPQMFDLKRASLKSSKFAIGIPEDFRDRLDARMIQEGKKNNKADTRFLSTLDEQQKLIAPIMKQVFRQAKTALDSGFVDKNEVGVAELYKYLSIPGEAISEEQFQTALAIHRQESIVSYDEGNIDIAPAAPMSYYRERQRTVGLLGSFSGPPAGFPGQPPAEQRIGAERRNEDGLTAVGKFSEQPGGTGTTGRRGLHQSEYPGEGYGSSQNEPAFLRPHQRKESGPKASTPHGDKFRETVASTTKGFRASVKDSLVPQGNKSRETGGATTRGFHANLKDSLVPQGNKYREIGGATTKGFRASVKDSFVSSRETLLAEVKGISHSSKDHLFTVKERSSTDVMDRLLRHVTLSKSFHRPAISQAGNLQKYSCQLSQLPADNQSHKSLFSDCSAFTHYGTRCYGLGDDEVQAKPTNPETQAPKRKHTLIPSRIATHRFSQGYKQLTDFNARVLRDHTTHSTESRGIFVPKLPGKTRAIERGDDSKNRQPTPPPSNNRNSDLVSVGDIVTSPEPVTETRLLREIFCASTTISPAQDGCGVNRHKRGGHESSVLCASRNLQHGHQRANLVLDPKPEMRHRPGELFSQTCPENNLNNCTARDKICLTELPSDAVQSSSLAKPAAFMGRSGNSGLCTKFRQRNKGPKPSSLHFSGDMAFLSLPIARKVDLASPGHYRGSKEILKASESQGLACDRNTSHFAGSDGEPRTTTNRFLHLRNYNIPSASNTGCSIFVENLCIAQCRTKS